MLMLTWKQARFYFIVILSQILCGCSGCSGCSCDYRPFQENEFGDMVESYRIWKVKLPYTSDKKVNIDVINQYEILVTEFKKGAYLTKIEPDRQDQIGPLKYLHLEHGDQYELYREGQNEYYLVLGDKEDKKYIYSVDYKNLSIRYAKDIPIPKDLYVSSRRCIENQLIFFSTSCKIERYQTIKGNMQYTRPYIASIGYHFHILDIETGNLLSFPPISANHLNEIGELSSKVNIKPVTLSAEIATCYAQAMNVSLDYKVQNYIFYVEDVFFVGGKQTFVFTTTNGDTYKNYALHLNSGTSSIKQYYPKELLLKYPTELIVKEKDKIKKSENKDVIISGIAYTIDRAQLFQDGVILLARKVGDKDNFSYILCVDTLILTEKKDKIDAKWCYQLKDDDYFAGSLIADFQNNFVYFPDFSENGKLLMKGLHVKDGKVQPGGLPANFIIQTRKEGKEQKEVNFMEIVGTSYDFKNKRIYIHDKKNNHIICTKLVQ